MFAQKQAANAKQFDFDFEVYGLQDVNTKGLQNIKREINCFHEVVVM